MIVAYKGFNKDMTCRGFQYELGKTYILEDAPLLCLNGFHACLMPDHVFEYYSNVEKCVYAKVFLNDDIDHVITCFDSKICGKAIAISDTLMTPMEIAIESYALADILKKEHHLDPTCCFRWPAFYHKMINDYDMNYRYMINGNTIVYGHDVDTFLDIFNRAHKLLERRNHG